METLLVGNMVMILFWIFMTLIANDAEKYKVIVLLYIITYLVNILKFEYRNWGCGHFLGPLILRYPHLSCCYKSLALSVLNWTQPSEGKLNSFFCVPVYIFIENLDKLLDSNISP